MKTNTKQWVEEALAELKEVHSISSSEIPDIALYMDQVTTLMEEQLSFQKRKPEDKVLTKTMINNYTKHNLLPPPVKKKYSKHHILFLVYIYYFKNFLSMKDIEALLSPFAPLLKEDSGFSFSQFYDKVSPCYQENFETFETETWTAFSETKQVFDAFVESEDDYFLLFGLISRLISDMYAKKTLIERLIDRIPTQKKDKKKG